MKQYLTVLAVFSNLLICCAYQIIGNKLKNVQSKSIFELKRNRLYSLNNNKVSVGSAKKTNSSLSNKIYVSNIQGASNVVLIYDETSKTKRYIPKQWLDNDEQLINSEDKWLWLQEQKMSENIFQNAVSSNMTDIHDYFTKYESYLSIYQADVLQKNLNYFHYLSNNDIDGLRSVYLDSNDTICVPSGVSAILSGYRNIINYLTYNLNEHPKLIYNPKNISIQYFGDVAIVTSIVDTAIAKSNQQSKREPNNNRNKLGIVSKSKDNKLITSPFYSTNIFVKPPDSDTYLLASHIGTPILSYDSKEAKRLRKTYQDPMFKASSSGGSSGMGRSQIITIQEMQNMFNNRFKGNQGGFYEQYDDDEEEVDGDDEEDDEIYDDEEGDDEDNDTLMINDEDDDDDDEYDEEEEEGSGDDDDDDDDEEEEDDDGEEGRRYRRIQSIKSAIERALRKFGMNPLSSTNNRAGMKNVMIIDTGRMNKANSAGGGNSNWSSRIIKALRGDLKKKLDEDEEDIDEEENETNKNKKENDGSNSLVSKNSKSTALSSTLPNDNSARNKRVSRGDRKSNSKYLIKDDDDEDLIDNGDYGDDEEEILKAAKLLASQTLKAVKWLYNDNRINLKEKSILINDIITRNAKQEFSKVEIAFSVIIGPGKPNELLSAVYLDSEKHLERSPLSEDSSSSSSNKNNKNLSSQSDQQEENTRNAEDKWNNDFSSIDMNTLDEDIVSEFQDICRILAKSLKLKNKLQ